MGQKKIGLKSNSWDCEFLVHYFVGQNWNWSLSNFNVLPIMQGAHYESTYNVNYKGEVGTRYLGFREKNNFYCPVSDKGSENCH